MKSQYFVRMGGVQLKMSSFRVTKIVSGQNMIASLDLQKYANVQDDFY